MINTLTLNPAVDRLLYIDKFERTVTARVREKAEALGGKGVHISVNLSLMKEPNRAFGILFGPTGAHIERTLAGMGVETRFVHGRGGDGRDSRTNYALIEATGSSTIIADRGVELDDTEVDAVLDMLRSHTEKGDTLVFSGDASNVPDPFVYNRFIEAMRDMSGDIYVDASGPALARALEAAPFLIKPNRDELESLTGMSIGSDSDAIDAMRAIGRYGIGNIALTLGHEGAIVKFGDECILRALPLEVDVKNTAGCGDAFLSGLIIGFARRMDYEQTLRLASAMSAATAASRLTVGFDTDYAETLFEKVKIRAL